MLLTTTKDQSERILENYYKHLNLRLTPSHEVPLFKPSGAIPALKQYEFT